MGLINAGSAICNLHPRWRFTFLARVANIITTEIKQRSRQIIACCAYSRGCRSILSRLRVFLSIKRKIVIDVTIMHAKINDRRFLIIILQFILALLDAHPAVHRAHLLCNRPHLFFICSSFITCLLQSLVKLCNGSGAGCHDTL